MTWYDADAAAARRAAAAGADDAKRMMMRRRDGAPAGRPTTPPPRSFRPHYALYITLASLPSPDTEMFAVSKQASKNVWTVV